MSARIVYIVGFIILLATGFVTYLQSIGRYGISSSIAAVLFLILGTAWAALTSQIAFHKQARFNILPAVLVSIGVLTAIYFIRSSEDTSSFLVAAVYTSCFLLPSVILQNWYFFKSVFVPVEIGSWLLPVPYVKSNAISLHLNSIPFTFRFTPLPGETEQEYVVTAPGIKTLGTVFSELVYDDKGTKPQDTFSNIRDNPYNWTFYVRELAGLSSRQLDANLSLLDNRLKNNAIVTAQRQ